MDSVVPSAKKDLIKEQQVQNTDETQNNLQSQIDLLKQDIENLQKQLKEINNVRRN